MENGRYPNFTSWSYELDWTMLVSEYPTSPAILQDWFLSADDVGEWECSIWNGTSWEPYRISIRPF